MFHVASKSSWSKTSLSNNEIAIERNKKKICKCGDAGAKRAASLKKVHENCRLKEIKTTLKIVCIPFLNAD